MHGLDPTKVKSNNQNKVHTTRQTLTGRTNALYNQNYHPMDDFIGRQNRKRKVEETNHCNTLLEDWNSDDNATNTSSSCSDLEEAQYQAPSGSRHSTRLAKKSRPLYNGRIHPQDRALRRAGISRYGTNRKKLRVTAKGRNNLSKCISDPDGVLQNDVLEVIEIEDASSRSNHVPSDVEIDSEHVFGISLLEKSQMSQSRNESTKSSFGESSSSRPSDECAAESQQTNKHTLIGSHQGSTIENFYCMSVGMRSSMPPHSSFSVGQPKFDSKGNQEYAADQISTDDDDNE